MGTILKPCGVPWAISPSMSGVTLTHSESDTEPECTVGFGGGRLTDDGRVDSRRIDLTFKLCYYARVGPHHDSETIEAIGYKIESLFEYDIKDYLETRTQKWIESGNCPDSGFYVAIESDWLPTLPPFFRNGFQHYVIDGRDGYVELIASRFAWREWIWSNGHRDDAALLSSVIGMGEGVA